MNFRSLLLAVCAAAGHAILSSTAIAATTSWKGTSNSNWSAGGNWTGGAPGVGDAASFDSNFTGGNQPSINSNTSVGQLVAAASLGKDVTIGGSRTLTLAGLSGIGIDQQSSYLLTINAPLAISGSQTWQGNNITTGGSLNLSGNTLTLAPNSGKTITLGGAISGSGGQLDVDGPGTIILSGSSANTFSGMTTVTRGELQLNKSSGNAIAGGGITIGDGAGTDIVRIMSNNQIADSAAVTINSSGQLLVNGTASDTIGSLNMTGGLVDTGSGYLVLSANPAITSNAHSSSATIAGEIRLQGSKTIQVADGSAAVDLDITANVVDMWYTSITKTGDGTLRLSGNNTFNGPFTISNGVIIAASSNALGASTWNNSIASGAALHLTGGISVTEGSIQVRGTGTDGNGALQSLSGANTFNGTLTVSEDATVGANAGSSLSLTGAIDLANDLTFAGAGDFNASGQIYGSGVFTKLGSGTLQFSGTTQDINGTRLDVLEGTVELNRAGKQLNTTQGPIVGTTSGPAATLKLLTNEQIRNDLFVDVKESGTLDLNGFNESLAGLRLYGGAVQTGAGTLTIANAGGDEIHSYASSQTATISGKLASHLAQGVTITTDDGAPSTDLNISAAISGSAVKWTKKGAGTLEYSGSAANTFTGQTIIDAGTLRLNKSSGVDAISGSSIKVNSGGTLMLANSNQIKNSTNLTLDGGTFSTGATTGFAEKLGTLTLSLNSSIDLGTGMHLLEFANSSGIVWNGTLTIYDWVGTPNGSPGTEGRIFFGNNASGLTSAQLSQISFSGFGAGAILLSSGELVPVVIPEAKVVFAALGIAALFIWRERRRLRLPAFLVRKAVA